MARIATKKYTFNVAPDSVKARVYYLPGTADPDYNSPFVEVPVPAGQTAMAVEIPGSTSITEGTYTLMASSLDAAGNESDLGAKVTFPFDFTAPSAPTDGAIN